MSRLKNCKPDDVIIISDADEIPNPEKIKKYAQTPGIKTFKQRMFYYYLNNIDLRQPLWVNTSSKMLKFKELNTLDNSPQKVRFQSGKIINKGGWHFSYLGGAEKISAKIKSFAHQEYNQAKFNDVATIQARVEQGKDIFLRSSGKRYASIKINKSFPKFLQEHQSFFSKYIKSENITNFDKMVLLINKILQNIKINLKNTVKKYYSKDKHHYHE
jgi:beta-1,4-mannosyl-glycoprotein beta-1,4-N-acetylglucosaminyltransferase